MKKTILFGVISAGIVSLCWSVYRDIQIEKLYPSDLRNRIVGARLQKDGKMPYFYKWKPADGLRYYDPMNFDTMKVSKTTTTPYFNQLLYPVADMEQRTISRFWVYLQYIFLFVMVGMALRFADTFPRKMLVFSVAVSFLFTQAWIKVIETGQMYLFVPVFAFACCFFLSKPKSTSAAFVSGLFAVSLVLIRPNTVFMFLPFLFLAGKYNLRYKVAFFVPVILVMGYIVSSGQQRALWENYTEGMSEQLKIHQGFGATSQYNGKDPEFLSWEGWNRDEIAAAQAKTTYFNYSENGNFFVLVEHIFGKKLSPAFLNIASLLLIGIITGLFYVFNKKTGFSLYNIALLGYSLYMISDLFSPFYRHQYNTVQWFFPLLLAAAGYIKRYQWIYAALAAGIILNIINSPYIKMEHTIGEYIILAALLSLAFVYNGNGRLKEQV